MAKTAAQRMREYRERIKNGVVVEFKHETPAQRVRRSRRLNREEIAKQKKLFKIEVLTHYGNGKCACVKCGESREPCLTIDHIEGHGNKHRKMAKAEGHGFYMWLKKNGYPGGLQTLCMNCQWVKRFENKEYNHWANVTTVTEVTTVTLPL